MNVYKLEKQRTYAYPAQPDARFESKYYWDVTTTEIIGYYQSMEKAQRAAADVEGMTLTWVSNESVFNPGMPDGLRYVVSEITVQS